MNKVILILGLFLYFFYIIGLFYKDVSGLSFLFVIVLVITFAINPDINLNKQALIFLLGFNLLIFFSFILNVKTVYSVYKTQMLFLKFNSLFLIPQFINKNHIQSFTKGLFYILIAVLLMIFFYCIGSLNSFDYNNRLEIGILNPIWITRIALECLILYFFLFNRNSIKTILLLCLILPVVYASGSKGPLFAFILTTIFYVLKDKNISIKNFKFIFGILFFLTVCFFAYSKLIQFDNYFTQRFLTIIPENVDLNATEDNRALFIPIIVNNFFNQDYLTILFGAGIGNTSKIFYGRYINDRFYPHNMTVEILCEFGLIVLIILIVTVIIFFTKTKGPYKYLFFYFILNSMFSGDIILNEFIFLYAGLAVATNSNSKTQNENHLSYN